MKDVMEFVAWLLTHTKNIPAGTYPIAKSKIGKEPWEYIFGSTGNRATKAFLDERYKNYYSKKGWTRAEFDEATKGWVERGQMVCDCQGLEDCFSKSQVTANTNYVKYCTNKGRITDINRPYLYGEAVFNGTDTKKTHVGWVVGFRADGVPLINHERGLSYGDVITPLNSPAWKYRGIMDKRYLYTDSTSGEVADDGKYVFTRVLKSGMNGKDVVALKALLIADGYTNGITAGNSSYGAATAKLVKAYQSDNGLTIDGKAGKNTITSLGGVWGA